MTVFQFIIACLATYRLTVLVSRDLGPFDIFKRLRALSPKWLGCPYCFSVTAAAVVCLGYYLVGVQEPLVIWAFLLLAMSGISIICDQTWTANHTPK